MPKKVIRNLQFGIGFSLFILIASSVASYWSIKNQMQHRENVSQSRRSVTAVKDVLIALLDAETGNRGYQLTGRESFLDPYNKSLAEYSKSMDYARSLDITEPEQVARLKQLEKNVEVNIKNLKQFVENRKRGLEMTQYQIEQSELYMDSCRSLVVDFVKFEESSLEKKNKDLDSSSSTTVWFIIFSSLAAIAVTTFFYIKLKDDLLRRDKLEKELKQKDFEKQKKIKMASNTST